MCCIRRILPLVLCLALPGQLVPGAGSESATADEQILRYARLATDGPSLLELFRKRTATEADRERVRALVRQLGSQAYLARGRASRELVELGTTAVPFLRQALQDPDLEIARRAEECLRLIEDKDLGPAITAAAARLVALRRPAGAAEVLLAYLPSADDELVAEEIRNTLAALAQADPRAEKALLTAVDDRAGVRRGAAADALGRSNDPQRRAAVRKLLQDADLLVRFRTAVALTTAGDREGVPVLIDLLTQVPLAQAWQAEDLLYRLAESAAPPGAALGRDDASRRRCRDAWTAWWREEGPKVELARLDTAPRLLGYTLLVLLDTGRVLELDGNNRVRWQIDNVDFPLDAQVLPGDHVLLAEHESNVVTERDRRGTVVWKHEIDHPLMAQRLPNGNTFIATAMHTIEVSRLGRTVSGFRPPNGEQIMRAQKLRNGEIALVTTPQLGGQVQHYVRVDPSGREIVRFPVQVRTSGGRVEVLPGERVLLPEMAHNRVVEYDANGRVVWEAAVEQPVAAVRLPNGHTLVTSMNPQRGAVELDRSGRSEVWQYKENGSRVTRAFRR
jgi:hypothetical protein